jgi:hypothetical protein
MKKLSILTIVLVFAMVLLATVLFSQEPALPPTEAFTAQEKQPQCPTSVNRGPDGKIHVQPGNHVFDNLQEYVAYLRSVYANGENATCIAPMIPHAGRQAQDGVLGGVGNGAISPSGVERESATRVPTDRVVLDTRQDGYSPSESRSINKLDDYEFTRIQELERAPRNSVASQESKNALVAQNILDWANLPFNSEQKADAEKEFVTGIQESGFREPKSGVFFANMEGTTVLPPDQVALKEREKALLAAYRPTDVSKHAVDSETERVAKLVGDVYANDPNWEPVITKTGENQWAVTELRPKARKEKWEEENTINSALTEGSLDPKVKMEILDKMNTSDPYFDKRGVVDRDNGRVWKYEDFNKWTPGLERMFAPTKDIKEWF